MTDYARGRADALREAAEIASINIFDRNEIDAMEAAYNKASKSKGHYETLFAVVSAVLRIKASKIEALAQKEPIA